MRRMMRGHQDLAYASAGAVACGTLSLLIPDEVLSLLFLAPLAFFLTGFAILAAALPRWRPEPALRAAASLGVSLAVLALGGILLNFLGGLRPLPWALLLVLIVIGCCRWAALARPARSARRLTMPVARLTVPSTLVIASGLLAACAGVAVAFHPVSADKAEGFTELWLRTSAAPGAVAVGVGNQEHQTTKYGLIARFAGARPAVLHVELRPGERDLLTMPVRGRTRSGPIEVAVTLYREGFPNQPYRRVSGWVPRKGAGG